MYIHKLLSAYDSCLQVAWLGQNEELTCEPASTLPRRLIDEFESGMISNGEIISNSRFGVVHHTLVVATSCAKDVPPAKQQKKNCSKLQPG